MATAITGYQNRVDIVFDLDAPTAAGNATFDLVVSRAFRVTGITAICKATNANTTVTVSRAGASIGVATLAVLNAVTRAASLTGANATLAVGDVLRVVVNLAGGYGTIVVQTDPVAYAEQRTITGV